MHILFVDDEASVLEGLQNRLRRYRKEWKMTFLTCGQDALDFMRDNPCEVLVTDMRMPGMDGAQLLSHVRTRHPTVIRLVLTGQTEKESMLKTLSTAHQILSKPCDAEKLKQTIEHTFGLQAKINDPKVREIISNVDGLPTLPKLNMQLAEIIAKDNYEMDDIASIIKREPSICARILQIVNSSFFGLNRNITDISEAITYIGINTLRCLVLNVELFNHFQNFSPSEIHYLKNLQQHSFLTATIAKQILTDSDLGKIAYSAAILHDIGKLVIEAFLPEVFADIIKEAEKKQCSLYQAEKTVLGFSHAEIGAYLLTLWDLPHTIVNNIAFHHEPILAGESMLGPVGAVHVADYLAHQVSSDTEFAYPHESISKDYLKSIGAEHKIEQWLAIAQCGLQD